MPKSVRESRLEFLREFLAGVALVEDWLPHKAIVPVRFSELTLTIDTSRNDMAFQFTKGIDQVIGRLQMLKRDFYLAQVNKRWPDGPVNDRDDGDDDDNE